MPTGVLPQPFDHVLVHWQLQVTTNLTEGDLLIFLES